MNKTSIKVVSEMDYKAIENILTVNEITFKTRIMLNSSFPSLDQNNYYAEITTDDELDMVELAPFNDRVKISITPYHKNSIKYQQLILKIILGILLLSVIIALKNWM